MGDAIVEVLDVTTSLATANHFGAVDGGRITLSGSLLPAKRCEPNLRVGVKVLTFDPAAGTAGQLVWYPDDPTATPEEVLCMAVRRRAFTVQCVKSHRHGGLFGRLIVLYSLKQRSIRLSIIALEHSSER